MIYGHFCLGKEYLNTISQINFINCSWGINPGLSNGLIYEGVSEVPFKFAGGSAAQVPEIQAIDIFLSILHEKGE